MYCIGICQMSWINLLSLWEQSAADYLTEDLNEATFTAWRDHKKIALKFLDYNYYQNKMGHHSDYANQISVHISQSHC